MAKTVRILAVLFGVQVLLALGLNMTKSDISDIAPDKPLLSQSLDNLDEIRITGNMKGGAGADGNADTKASENTDRTLVLKRKDDKWQLPGLGGFPANTDQANQLLDALANAKQGLPVATSASAQSRFKVAKNAFERQLVLKRDGDDLVTVYLGSSPGTDQSYARIKGEKAIYRVKLAAYQAPVADEDWLDKTILTVPIDRITAIDVGNLTLAQTQQDKAKADGAAPAPWHADSLPDGKTLNTRAVAKLAGQLSGLRIKSLVDDNAAAQKALSAPAIKLTLDKQDGKAVVYTLAPANDKKAPWYLSVSDRDRTFHITSAVGETLQKAASEDALLTAEAMKTSAPVAAKTETEGDEPAE